MKLLRFSVFGAVVIATIAAPLALADPHPNELLKFYQMPLNNGLTPYLPVVSYPAPSTNGLPPYGTVPSTAIFPGHDEFSTAYASAYDPLQEAIAWQGQYMADDFADYAGTPITHVRWWGSYMNNQEGTGVKKFLISFEHNVPAVLGPGGEVLEPSHPDPFHPGNLHQIVDLTPLPGPPAPGTFTEMLIPTGAGPIPPPEPLMEYNAELHIDKWFGELAATEAVVDDVYWLKIVALVDPLRDGQIDWGWHNRDWSIPDALAAIPPDTPDGGEFATPTPFGPVWHFEDDAVTGGIFISPGMSPIMPTVDQTGFDPQNYVYPWDGPPDIQGFSKDLAFELYTIVPEPASVVLMCLGVVGLVVARRRSNLRS